MENIETRFADKYNVSRETFLQLSDYIELLQKWQQKINLISNATTNDIWFRHIEDSLQLLNYVPRETLQIIDLGSGGGLPAIPLAITTKKPVFMVESDKRKCAFLEEAIRITELNLCKSFQSRVENAKLPLTTSHGIIITARALAETTDLFRIIKLLILNNNISECRILLPKGKDAASEVERAKLEWEFEFTTHQSITDQAATILEIKNLREKL